jgi:hypothetical protein
MMLSLGKNPARGFAPMRSYIVSCNRNGINSYTAIKMLINGQVPEYIKEILARDSKATSYKTAA